MTAAPQQKDALMATIHEYLLACAKDQFARDRNPVVGMDCIAAKVRGEFLERIAAEVGALAEEAALLRLKTLRDAMREPRKEIGASVIGWVFSMSDSQWFDGVVDRIAREPVGWIEVSSSGFDGKKLLNLPAYSRKLGVNHRVAYIARRKDEADADWLRRRAEWLSAYHPDVEVVHQRARFDGKGSSAKVVLGTAASFAKIEHMVEADLVTVRAFRLEDGACLEVVEALLKPNASGAIATVRQVSGPPREPGVVKMPHYDLELVA